MKYFFILFVTSIFFACSNDGNNESKKITDLPTVVDKESGKEGSLLQESEIVGDSLVKFEDLDKQTLKIQKLVHECLDIYKIKSIERFRYTPYVSKNMIFEEKLKLTISLQKIKKNRFDETYYENFDCEWYGEEYKLAKKKSPEEIIKQSGEKIKIEN